MSSAAISRLSIGQCATLACLLEVAAPKVGNVHRGADFEDLTFADFAVSAVALGPAMEQAENGGVGWAVLEAVKATRRLVATNTNLGIALLVGPLAAVPRARPLTAASVHAVLGGLTAEDCRQVYAAIRAAQPGGLGRVEEMDVAGEPPADLLAAMRAAAERDLVARQYAEDFAIVLDEAAPHLAAGCERGWTLTESVVHAHLTLLAAYGDSLIARKCGPEVARQAAVQAARVLECGGPGDEAYYEAAADLDFWLRSDGHRRNPGATADLLAAALFVVLRDERVRGPWR